MDEGRRVGFMRWGLGVCARPMAGRHCERVQALFLYGPAAAGPGVVVARGSVYASMLLEQHGVRGDLSARYGPWDPLL
jgi:hypothetical protein